jgi:hypothetical protein
VNAASPSPPPGERVGVRGRAEFRDKGEILIFLVLVLDPLIAPK